MATFALVLEYDDQYMTKREPYAEGHMAHLQAAIGRGEVLYAGAMMNEKGVPTGFIVFDVEDPAKVEDYAKTDPNVTGGVATGYKVQVWYGIHGPGAVQPG